MMRTASFAEVANRCGERRSRSNRAAKVGGKGAVGCAKMLDWVGDGENKPSDRGGAGVWTGDRGEFFCTHFLGRHDQSGIHEQLQATGLRGELLCGNGRVVGERVERFVERGQHAV